jgi:hypothetical protein
MVKSTTGFNSPFNVLRPKRHVSAFVASVGFFVAFPAKHDQIFRRVKFAPFAIFNVVRVRGTVSASESSIRFKLAYPA